MKTEKYFFEGHMYEAELRDNFLNALYIDGAEVHGSMTFVDEPNYGAAGSYVEFDPTAAEDSFSFYYNDGWSTVAQENYKREVSFVNCTPHEIVLNDGRRFAPCGKVARVGQTHSKPDCNGICVSQYSEPFDLPEPQQDVRFIVSSLVLAACPDRTDLVAPATGHPDCVRNEGRIVSVPCFIRNAR